MLRLGPCSCGYGPISPSLLWQMCKNWTHERKETPKQLLISVGNTVVWKPRTASQPVLRKHNSLFLFGSDLQIPSSGSVWDQFSVMCFQYKQRSYWWFSGRGGPHGVKETGWRLRARKKGCIDTGHIFILKLEMYFKRVRPKKLKIKLVKLKCKVQAKGN